MKVREFQRPHLDLQMLHRHVKVLVELDKRFVHQLKNHQQLLLIYLALLEQFLLALDLPLQGEMD